MATARIVGGYCWRQSLADAQRSNRTCRTFVRRILEERPSQALLLTYIAQIAIALGENQEALQALTEIAGPPPEAEVDATACSGPAGTPAQHQHEPSAPGVPAPRIVREVGK